jgi:hypothetical protein
MVSNSSKLFSRESPDLTLPVVLVLVLVLLVPRDDPYTYFFKKLMTTITIMMIIEQTALTIPAIWLPLISPSGCWCTGGTG